MPYDNSLADNVIFGDPTGGGNSGFETYYPLFYSWTAPKNATYTINNCDCDCTPRRSYTVSCEALKLKELLA